MKIDYFKVFSLLVNLLDIQLDIVDNNDNDIRYCIYCDSFNRLSFEDFDLICKALESVGRFV